MTKGRVLLGVVAAPHGVRGLVRIRSFTEDPMAIAAYGPLSDETGQKQYRVEALSAVKGAVLARIEGVADRTAAEAAAGVAALCGARARCRRRASGSGTRRTSSVSPRSAGTAGIGAR